MRLVGDPRYEPVNLDDNWSAQFGSYIEPFALDWHQRTTGHPIVRRGAAVWREASDHFLHRQVPTISERR